MAQSSKSSGPKSSGAKSRSTEARARAQAQRAAIAKQERNRKLLFGGLWSSVAAVVVVVIVLVVVFQHNSKTGTAALNAPVTATVANDLATIPASTYSTVGVTGVGTSVAGLQQVSGGTPITVDGKPTLVYIGGEFCPYCAAERWSLTAALARFGTFSGLETTRSAADDGNYWTLTYLHAKYTSDYVNFTPYEVSDRAQKKLQTPDAAAEASLQKYDPKGSVPFFSINNVYIGSSQYDPSLLGTSTPEQIAAALKDPSSTLGKNAIAASNVITAGICAVDGAKPTTVCSAPEVTAAAKYLNSQSTGSGSSSTG